MNLYPVNMVLPQLTRTSASCAAVHVLDFTESTNDDARKLALSGAGDFEVVVTDDQRGGRGRLGRTWVSPAGKCVAVSVILRPRALFANPDTLGWIPLIAGLSMTRAVNEELTFLTGTPLPTVELKWPNDVLVSGKKVSGILAELNFDEQFVVVGVGINLSLGQEELPTEHSTSLALAAGSDPDVDRLLASFLAELSRLMSDFMTHGGDPFSSGVHEAVSKECGTLGKTCSTIGPDGTTLTGEVMSIDSMGNLVMHCDGRDVTVRAGDITEFSSS